MGVCIDAIFVWGVGSAVRASDLGNSPKSTPNFRVCCPRSDPKLAGPCIIISMVGVSSISEIGSPV